MPDSSRPVPPSAKQQKQQLTVKQQREARRAEKVAALQRQQAKQRRTRLIAIITGSVAVLAVIAVVIVFVVTSAAPKPSASPSSTTADGVDVYTGLTATHTTSPVTYSVIPPVGGNHNPVWLNCGVYTQQVPNENAVHDLEHGAVWITYDPAVVTQSDIDALRKRVPDTYIVISPYPGIPAPVIASAWGAQLKMTGVDDTRLDSFIKNYWKSPNAPEPGAACTGGLDAPGKVS